MNKLSELFQSSVLGLHGGKEAHGHSKGLGKIGSAAFAQELGALIKEKAKEKAKATLGSADTKEAASEAAKAALKKTSAAASLSFAQGKVDEAKVDEAKSDKASAKSLLETAVLNYAKEKMGAHQALADKQDDAKAEEKQSDDSETEIKAETAEHKRSAAASEKADQQTSKLHAESSNALILLQVPAVAPPMTISIETIALHHQSPEPRNAESPGFHQPPVGLEAKSRSLTEAAVSESKAAASMIGDKPMMAKLETRSPIQRALHEASSPKAVASAAVDEQTQKRSVTALADTLQTAIEQGAALGRSRTHQETQADSASLRGTVVNQKIAAATPEGAPQVGNKDQSGHAGSDKSTSENDFGAFKEPKHFEGDVVRNFESGIRGSVANLSGSTATDAKREAAHATAAQPTALPEENNLTQVNIAPGRASVQMTTPNAEDLTLHLRVRDGVTDVSVSGTATHLFEARTPDLRIALAQEGLQLGKLETSNHSQNSNQSLSSGSDSNSAQQHFAGNSAEDRQQPPQNDRLPPRQTFQSSGPELTEQGRRVSSRIHIKA